MKRFFLLPALFFVCVVYLFFGEEARAGNIVLQMQMTLTVASDRIDVRITAANYGTEPARDVQAVKHVNGTSVPLMGGHEEKWSFEPHLVLHSAVQSCTICVTAHQPPRGCGVRGASYDHN